LNVKPGGASRNKKVMVNDTLNPTKPSGVYIYVTSFNIV